MYENRTDNFGNGRDVRNLFEDTIIRQANRLAAMENPTREDLVTFIPEDFREEEEETAGAETAEPSELEKAIAEPEEGLPEQNIT